jgi:tripartite-type tricarboxylate transporter receptor subunit TctC
MIRSDEPRRIARLAAGAIAILLASTASLRADAAEDFFRGRQLTIYIGGGIGGAIDTYGRLLARHIVRHLPGKPAIVARNFPAAGGVQAYMTLGSTAPRDGSAFATSARGPLTDPLYAEKPATYDVRKFVWIGAMNDDSTICYTGAESKIKTLAQAMANETTMASTGALAESAKFPKALNATIGTRFKVITGYSGTANTALAVERGETDGRCNTVGSVRSTMPGALEKRTINLLVQVGTAKVADLPDVPLALDLAKTQSDRDLLKLMVAPLAIASAFALPPDVPPDRVAVWRKAFAAMLIDPAFLDDAAKISFEVTARTGPQVEAIIRDIYATPWPVVARAREVFEPAR